jgi:hypothetical protein
MSYGYPPGYGAGGYGAGGYGAGGYGGGGYGGGRRPSGSGFPSPRQSGGTGLYGMSVVPAYSARSMRSPTPSYLGMDYEVIDRIDNKSWTPPDKLLEIGEKIEADVYNKIVSTPSIHSPSQAYKSQNLVLLHVSEDDVATLPISRMVVPFLMQMRIAIAITSEKDDQELANALGVPPPISTLFPPASANAPMPPMGGMPGMGAATPRQKSIYLFGGPWDANAEGAIHFQAYSDKKDEHQLVPRSQAYYHTHKSPARILDILLNANMFAMMGLLEQNKGRK